MKKLIICIILLISLEGYSQKDCNAKPITVIGSIEMGVNKGMLTESFKVGIWQNNKPNGVTLLGGYQIGLSTFNLKNESTSQVQSLFVELGYKMRIAKPIIIQGYGGINLIGKYVGVASYVIIQDDLMVGGFYKQGILGGTLLFAF